MSAEIPAFSSGRIFSRIGQVSSTAEILAASLA